MFEDVHVDGAQCGEVVNTHFLLLTVVAVASNGLRHCGVVLVLAFYKKGGDEDDMVGVGKVAVCDQCG